MYFDFDNYRTSNPRRTAISAREAVVLSVIVHCSW